LLRQQDRQPVRRMAEGQLCGGATAVAKLKSQPKASILPNFMRTKTLFIFTALCTVIALGLCTLDAQAPQRTAKEGIYTDAQANRGADYIRAIGCANCHGNTLEGGPNETPSLVGNEFVNEWANQTAYDLYIKVTSMPPDHTDKRPVQED